MEAATSQVQAEITYRLSALDETTIFRRELTYLTSGLWFWVLDFLLMRRRMNRKSRIALEQLKERHADSSSSKRDGEVLPLEFFRHYWQ
jgi:hypothetical protein